MSKLYTGGASFGFSLDFNTAVPVDTRLVVDSLTDLKDPKTWISGTYNSSDDSANVYVVYPGLTVTVKEEGTIYVYTPSSVSGALISDDSSWSKIATSIGAEVPVNEVKKAVGLNDDGTHKSSTGNYTKNATTVEEEISALDTAIGAKTSTGDDVYGAINKEISNRKSAIEALDSDFDKGDDFVNLKITQTDGLITKVEIASSDVASEKKITNSATLKEGTGTYETAITIKYIGAVSGTPAHIALVDKNGIELSTVGVSDIIGNGLLDSHSYDSSTGVLTLNFKQADGTTKAEEIDLGKMLDIDDVLIGSDSKSYLSVDLSGAENSQAVFKALIVKLSEAGASKTGLVDAYDAKQYVDNALTNTAISAAGDSYVGAAVDGTNNKKINVSTNVRNLTVTSEAGKDSTITGTANSLVDGGDAAGKIGSFVNSRISEEINKLDATNVSGSGSHVTVKVNETNGVVDKVIVEESDIASAALLGTASDDKSKSTAFGAIAKEVEDRKAAIQNLDADKSKTGTNVTVGVKEVDGIVTEVSVSESYATITRTEGTTNPALSVSGESGLVIGSDIAAVKGYTDDIVSKEKSALTTEINKKSNTADIRFEVGTGTGSAVLKGEGNTAVNEGEVAIGKYNSSTTGSTTANKTLFSVGNGTSTSKSNAIEVRENGDVWINLGSSYQKLQTILSNEIDWYEGN